MGRATNQVATFNDLLYKIRNSTGGSVSTDAAMLQTLVNYGILQDGNNNVLSETDNYLNKCINSSMIYQINSFFPGGTQKLSAGIGYIWYSGGFNGNTTKGNLCLYNHLKYYSPAQPHDSSSNTYSNIVAQTPIRVLGIQNNISVPVSYTGFFYIISYVDNVSWLQCNGSNYNNTNVYTGPFTFNVTQENNTGSARTCQIKLRDSSNAECSVYILQQPKAAASASITGSWMFDNTKNPNTDNFVCFKSTNQGVNSSICKSTITVSGVTSFTCYIRSYAESTYDYTVISNINTSLPNYSSSAYPGGSGSIPSSSNVKAHTRGNQQSNYTSLSSNWTSVTYSSLSANTEYTIDVGFVKDVSSGPNDDTGYILLPIYTVDNTDANESGDESGTYNQEFEIYFTNMHGYDIWRLNFAGCVLLDSNNNVIGSVTNHECIIRDVEEDSYHYVTISYSYSGVPVKYTIGAIYATPEDAYGNEILDITYNVSPRTITRELLGNSQFITVELTSW